MTLDYSPETLQRAESLPPTNLSMFIPHGMLYPSFGSLVTPQAFSLFGVSISLKKVKINSINLKGVKGTNYWQIKNTGQLPLINGSYKLDNKLNNKKVTTDKGGFTLQPNQSTNVNTPWSMSWKQIFKLIESALKKKQVGFGMNGTISAAGINKNINRKSNVPISK